MRYRAFPDCARFPLGDNAELVYTPLTRTARTLSPVAAAILFSCGRFATLEEHAARVCRDNNLRPEQQPTVLAQLTGLADAGLLVSQSDLERHCRREGPALLPPAPIATVGIPTRNRPESLARCVESHLESRRRHGRLNDYVVVDDSDDPQVRQGNRDLLRALGARYGAPIAYAGPEEKARFVAALVERCDLPRDAVEFGLLNPERHAVTTGASRNLLLLHTAGDVCLQVDDDTLAQVAPCPAARDGLALSSRFDPTAFWFLPDDEPNVAETAGGADLLAVHERLLGRRPGDCMTAPGELDLDHVGAAFFRKRGTVVVSAAGVAGDSGMGSSIAFLTLDDESRSRLLRSERDYRHALAGHRVLRGVTRPTICDAAYCMALNLGLDNRRPLPPFLPVLRNQDGVFAALVRGSLGDDFFGFLPRVVLHKPPTARPASAVPWREAVRLRGGQIIQTLLRAIPLSPTPTDPAGSLRKLGQAVVDMASMPQPDFDETVRLQLWAQMSRQATHLTAQLHRYGEQPDYWAADVRQLLAALAEELPNERFPVPSDIDDRGRFRALVLRLGHLLQAWPDIVAAARNLRAHGVRPALPV